MEKLWLVVNFWLAPFWWTTVCFIYMAEFYFFNRVEHSAWTKLHFLLVLSVLDLTWYIILEFFFPCALCCWRYTRYSPFHNAGKTLGPNLWQLLSISSKLFMIWWPCCACTSIEGVSSKLVSILHISFASNGNIHLSKNQCSVHHLALYSLWKLTS